MRETQKKPRNARFRPGRVPWTGLDVVLLFLLYVSLVVVSFDVVSRFVATPPTAVAQTPDPAAAGQAAEHPMTQFLEQGRHRPMILLVALFSGVLAAPLVEEFLFRLVLLGWLEKTFRRLRVRAARRIPRSVAGIAAVICVSLFFAGIHGGRRTTMSAESLFSALLGLGIGSMLTVLAGMAYLSVVHRATLAELGLDLGRAGKDFLTATALYFTTVPPILILHAVVRHFQPDRVTDPVPLFFFAVVLGTLFLRTRRLLPCVLLHAMLNGGSFLILALR